MTDRCQQSVLAVLTPQPPGSPKLFGFREVMLICQRIRDDWPNLLDRFEVILRHVSHLFPRRIIESDLCNHRSQTKDKRQASCGRAVGSENKVGVDVGQIKSTRRSVLRSEKVGSSKVNLTQSFPLKGGCGTNRFSWPPHPVRRFRFDRG